MWRKQIPLYRSISARYALLMGAITVGLLLASGLTEMSFAYRDARKQIGTLQALQASTAAAEIEQYLDSVRTAVRSVSMLPWGQPGFDIAQRRNEMHRLMALLPAIVDLAVMDRHGRQLLSVSRVRPDRFGSSPDDVAAPGLASLPPGEFRFGRTFFHEQEQPFVQLIQADAADDGDVTIATLNLRFLGDVIARLRAGVPGQIYLVDETNQLIAHPRATHVLRRLDLGEQEAVMAARRSVRQSLAMNTVDTLDIDGNPVMSTAVQLAIPGWLLFVEQPRSEALRPAIDALTRTALLVAAALVLAFAASLLFARRMAAPIVRLRRATERMAGGDFASRVPEDRVDELGQLAQDFNRMAARLEESYAGLEARIAERTRELAQARDAAERASSAKTRFLATASHDLRQPMHTIGLLVTVLCTELRDRRALKVAEKLQTCVRLMEALFSSLLDISKLDAGGVRVIPETFPVDELLRRVVQAFEPQAQEKGMVLRLRRSNAMVRADAALLERVLTNLVANAIQYAQRGKVLVGCRRRGEMLAVQVWDTGPGIEAAQLEAIFEEFYRIDAAGSHNAGLGLGLSIVKRSIELMGHRLQVRSWPGRGSLFEVLLPYVGSRAPAPSSPGAEAVAAEAGQLAGAFVLLIDDHEDNRMALESLCRDWDCHVLSASSQGEAAAALADHLRVPDLLISDYRLGDGGDGLDAVQALRRTAGETLPALLITAEQEGAIHARARELGVPVLQKPVGPELLRKTAETLLRRSAEQGANKLAHAPPGEH
jgi:signal transduction histidine kinase/CheY-like chemotaxis protein